MKTLYSQKHTARLLFNPGTQKEVRQEIESILANPFLSQKFNPTLNSKMELTNTSLYSLVEILLRSRTLQDLQLEIASQDVFFESSFRKFCDNIKWSEFLKENSSLHLKLTSTQSNLYHESMLKEIFTERLKNNFKAIVVPRELKALSTLCVELKDNHCRLFLSLAGQPLYQRSFREIGNSPAPLREDLAQSCILSALDFCKEENFQIQNLWIPFGGTGTFIFEYLMKEFNIAPCIFRNSYALQHFNFFNEKNFTFILKKAKNEILIKSTPKIFYEDYSEEMCGVFKKNFENFKKDFGEISAHILCENFFSKSKRPFEDGDCFVALNPPYGVRLHSHLDIVSFYESIAKTLLNIKKNRLGGFILCPSEETWSAFSKILSKHAKLSTYHLTQGGLDIRVCLFTERNL